MADESSRLEVDLEFPVSIEAVLSVNFSVENFRLVFDFILKTLNAHAQNINVVQTECSDLKNHRQSSEELWKDLSSKISALQETSQEHSEQISSSKGDISRMQDSLESLSSLEGKVSSLNEKLGELQADHSKQIAELWREMKKTQESVGTLEESQKAAEQMIDRVSEVSQNHEVRISQLEGDIDSALQAIRSMGGQIEAAAKRQPADVPPVVEKNYDRDINRLSSEISNLKLSFEDFQNKVPQQDNGLTRRVEILEEDSNVKTQNIKKNKEDIEELKKALKNLEIALNNKVNAEDFDMLQQHLASMGSPGSAPAPAISTKDLNLLRDLSKKVEDIFKSLEALNNLAERVSLLEQNKADKSELESLRKLLEQKADKSDLDSLRKFIESIAKLKADKADLEALGGLSDKGSAKGEVDMSKFNALSRRLLVVEEFIQKLFLPEGTDFMTIIKDIQHLKSFVKDLSDSNEQQFKDIYSRIKDLEALLRTKVSFDDLKDLESKIEEKVIAICGAMGKKFADKAETKKALKYLEKLIKELMQVHRGGGQGDDALLARKPLGGWSCASCEKALEKLAGRIGSYHPWNKLPQRDPADRIARAGPGFSRMLATFQPDLLSHRTRTSGLQGQSPHTPRYEEEEVVSLPPVVKQERPQTSYHP